MRTVSFADIEAARRRIRDVVVETPLVPAFGLDVTDGNALWLKAENLQRTASFKMRGAYNAIASLSEDERARGVITYSSGNHGQAVACAAQLLGVNAIIVMPEDAVPVKVAATRVWGADIVFAGHTSLDRQERALDLSRDGGYAVIPPFDDPRIIAGQGTIGTEIIEQGHSVDAVCVPVGGGGLLSGIAIAIKAMRPSVRVIGVEPRGGADAQESWRTGQMVTWDHVDTVADGLRASRLGELNLSTIRDLVDDMITVTDEEILQTVHALATRCKLVAEPSGAVATAGVLFGRTGLRDSHIVSVVSGGNIEPAELTRCLDASMEALQHQVAT